MIDIPKDIEWKFISSIGFDTHHHAILRNEKYGIQKEVITEKDELNQGFKKAKSYYFIDNVEKEFHSINEMVEFYNEKFKYEEDNPDQEVTYVKIIKKRER